GNVNSSLTTPSFSTVGRTSLSLQWNQGYLFNGSGTGTVQISINGGVTYTTLATFNTSSPSVITNQFTSNPISSINLNAYLGQPNVNIRFNYIGAGSTSTWAIDNVNVVGPYQPVTYSWSGPGITTTGSTVTFTPPAGNNTYTIVTTTGGCTSTSTTVNIVVNTPPAITTPPAVSGAQCVGSSASISATAAGTNASYQWQVSTDGGTTYKNITGVPYSNFTTNTLNVSTTTLAMISYLYRLAVSATGPCTDT